MRVGGGSIGRRAVLSMITGSKVRHNPLLRHLPAACIPDNSTLFPQHAG